MARPDWHDEIRALLAQRGGKYVRTHRQGYPIWKLGRFEIGFASSTPELEIRRIIKRWDGENAWDEDRAKKEEVMDAGKRSETVVVGVVEDALDKTEPGRILAVVPPSAPLPQEGLFCRYPPCPRTTGEPYKHPAHRARHETSMHGAVSARASGAPRPPRATAAPRVAKKIPINPATEFERIAAILLHETGKAIEDVVIAALTAVGPQIQAMLEARLAEMAEHFRRVSVERDVAVRDRDAAIAQLQDVERAIRSRR